MCQNVGPRIQPIHEVLPEHTIVRISRELGSGASATGIQMAGARIDTMTDRRAVIFDVDGVLVDSYAAHFQSWQAFAAPHGFVFTEALFKQTFGRTSQDILRLMWPDRALSDDLVRRWDREKEARFREIIRTNFPAMPGARALLVRLHAAGFGLAVGSSGPPENVQLVLDQLDPEKLVKVQVTGADVTRGKPDPQVFLLAAERLHSPPEACVVVEDAPAGIEAAHRAGMRCIGLASTGRTHEELAAADLRVTRLSELSPETIMRLWENGPCSDS